MKVSFKITRDKHSYECKVTFTSNDGKDEYSFSSYTKDACDVMEKLMAERAEIDNDKDD